MKKIKRFELNLDSQSGDYVLLGILPSSKEAIRLASGKYAHQDEERAVRIGADEKDFQFFYLDENDHSQATPEHIQDVKRVSDTLAALVYLQNNYWWLQRFDEKFSQKLGKEVPRPVVTGDSVFVDLTENGWVISFVGLTWEQKPFGGSLKCYGPVVVATLQNGNFYIFGRRFSLSRKYLKLTDTDNHSIIFVTIGNEWKIFKEFEDLLPEVNNAFLYSDPQENIGRLCFFWLGIIDGDKITYPVRQINFKKKYSFQKRLKAVEMGGSTFPVKDGKLLAGRKSKTLWQKVMDFFTFDPD